MTPYSYYSSDSWGLAPVFDALNKEHFEDELEEPLLKWNPKLSASAGRFKPGCLNFSPVIEIALYLKDIEDSEKHIRATMLHEMIHLWLWSRGRPYGHNKEFHAKMKAVGAIRFNPVPKIRPFPYFYKCIACGKIIPTRRKLVDCSCLTCGRKYGNGKFSEKYLLVRITDTAELERYHSAIASDARKKSDEIHKGMGLRLEEEKKKIEEPDPKIQTPPQVSIETVNDKLKSLRDLVNQSKIRTDF